MRTMAAVVVLVRAGWSHGALTQETAHRIAEDMETYLWRSTADPG